MASLVIHSDEPLQAASFSRRVLIGRKAFNGVQLGQRVVSRIHAWIDRDADSFYVCDARSRGGTFVNGARAEGKVILRDGDEITVGPARIIFHDLDAMPDGAVTFGIGDDGTNPDFKNPGILIACACGAPMWVPASMAGAFGRCAICKGEINVPGEPASGIRRPLTPNDSIVDMPTISQPVELGASARPFDPLAAEFPQPKPLVAAQICGICQSPILAGEVTTACPNCSLNYHVECWRENRGCAAYGCSQVGALDADQPTQASAPAAGIVPEPALAASVAQSPRAFPWHFALLGCSVIGSVLGAFTFGVPALAVGAASTVYAMRQRDDRHRVATLSAVICLFGVAFGVIASRFVWFNLPLWGGP
jgi:hypothetical protein